MFLIGMSTGCITDDTTHFLPGMFFCRELAPLSQEERSQGQGAHRSVVMSPFGSGARAT